MESKTRKKWLPEEDDIIKQNYLLKIKDIAKLLNRTTKSVIHRYEKLGLKKPKSIYLELQPGAKFGRWTLIDAPYIDGKYSNRIIVKGKVRCDCGTEDIKQLKAIFNGHSKSCGCLSSEVSSLNATKRNTKYTNKEIIKHSLYRQWSYLIKSYEVCKQWQNYENFYNWAILHYQPNTRINRNNLEPYSENNSFFIKYKAISREESELGRWLKTYVDDFKTDKTILKGQHIDFYSPSLKLGIEYCGLIWHNEKSKSPRLKNYHYNKYKKCLSSGIRLITIFSDEMNLRTKQTKNFLLSVLSKSEKRIFARKCEVKQLTTKEGGAFCKANHIQGASNSLVYYGLIYNKEIVAVMSLGRHPRKSSDLVLNRLCYTYNTSIIGGASKLFKACKQWAVTNNYTKIISWSDNRWTQGNVYEKLGFTLDAELGPDYSYVELIRPNKRKSKQSMMKSKTGCPKNITEKQFAENSGYARIWDCGKKRWIYSLT